MECERKHARSKGTDSVLVGLWKHFGFGGSSKKTHISVFGRPLCALGGSFENQCIFGEASCSLIIALTNMRAYKKHLDLEGPAKST
jgi:hypothetical protein